MNISSILLLIQSVLSLLANIQGAPAAQQQAALQIADQVLVVAKETLNFLTMSTTTTTTTTQDQYPSSTQSNTVLPLYGPALQL